MATLCMCGGGGVPTQSSHVVVTDQNGYLKRIDVGQTASRSERVVSADDCRAAKQVGRLSVDQRGH